MSFRYIDIHSHLNLPQFDEDREIVINDMQEEGVATTTVGIDYESSASAVALADGHPNLFATIGLHPADNRAESFDAARYAALVANPKVVAVGECGLDYYRLSNVPDIEAEKSRQKAEFEKQILFAKEHQLPLMIHGRPSKQDGKGTMDAYQDVLKLLRLHAGPDLSGNVHFFVGDAGIAKSFLDLNFTLSFTGVITFSRDYDEVIRFAPLSMIHAETDSPFAAPEPFRGSRAFPAHVSLVAAALASIRGEDEEAVRLTLLQNALRTFPRIQGGVAAGVAG